MDKVAECAAAIRAGHLDALRLLLTANPALASASHVATDWPGHFPHVSASIALLIAHGANVDAAFTGRHSERPLHWAASSDDVDALDALLDQHAGIEAPGAVIGSNAEPGPRSGKPPLSVCWSA